MSLSNPSPTCLVNAASTVNGVNVTASSTYTISLADTAGVKQWSISCINTDELLVAATITGGLTINLVTKTVTGTAPAAGSALIFMSVVNNGKDANGVVDPSLTTTFGVYVLTATTYRVGAFNEFTEGSSAYGWVTKLNPLIRGVVVNPASAGAGMTFSAGAYNVIANADGSIVVNADDIQLKPAFTTLLASATSAATNNALAQRTNTGGCSFAGLVCTTLAASAAVTCSTTLGVTGVCTFGNNVNVTGILGVSGSSVLHDLSVTNGAAVGGTFAVTLGSAFTGAVTCGSTLGVTSTATFSAGVGVTGLTTCTGGILTNSITAAISANLQVLHGTQTSDIATNNLYFQPMLPFSAAASNKKPGDFIINFPPAAGASVVDGDQASFYLQVSGVSHSRQYLGSSGAKSMHKSVVGLQFEAGSSDRTSNSSSTDAVTFKSGVNSGTAGSGAVNIQSGNATTSSSTGDITISTGQATAGAGGLSGSIRLTPGSALLRGNVYLGGGMASISGGNCVAVSNASTIPSSNPVGGGILYVSGGALIYRGSGGTITTVAPA